MHDDAKWLVIPTDGGGWEIRLPRARQLRRWRADRIRAIQENKGPVQLESSACVVLHLIPAEDLEGESGEAFLSAALDQPNLKPLYAHGSNGRVNFDGLLRYSQAQGSACDAYLQLFKTGALETVCSSLMGEANGRKFIASVLFEQELITTVEQYLGFLRSCRVAPPLSVFLTLLNVRGFTMGVDQAHERWQNTPIDRDHLVIDTLSLESFDVDVAVVLRPIFDATWQAAGFRGSGNYNEQATWIGGRR